MVNYHIGEKFNSLTILSVPHTKNNCNYVKCLCDCGNESVVRLQHVLSGHTKSCGCHKNILNDLTNKQFGYLHVIGRDNDYITPKTGKKYVRWKCICRCGNTTVVDGTQLKKGKIYSCGCMKLHSFVDLSNIRFGNLIVIKRVSDYVNKSNRKLVRYECQCDCGKIIFSLANDLRNGYVTSCGCKVNSKGEAIVKSYLDSLRLQFEQHISFEDCLNFDGNRLNFDFYVPIYNLLIECNGIQHYESIDFFGGDERFNKQRLHDKLKEEYAIKNNFNYLVIDCRKDNLKYVNDILNKYISSLKVGVAVCPAYL